MNEHQVVIGIDPGMTGGVAILDSGITIDDIAEVYMIPKNEISKNKYELNIRKLWDILDDFKYYNPMVFLEDVHSLYGMSAGSNFKFGWVLGVIEGVIGSLGYEVHKVTPKRWQKIMFDGMETIMIPEHIDKKGKLIKAKKDTKAMSGLKALELYPDVDLYITEKGNKSKNIHDGLSDAICIMEYGKKLINL